MKNMHILKQLSEERRIQELAAVNPQDVQAQAGVRSPGVQELPTSQPVGNAADPKDPSRAAEMQLTNAIARATGSDPGRYKTLVKAAVVYGCIQELNDLVQVLGSMTTGRYRTLQQRFKRPLATAIGAHQ